MQIFLSKLQLDWIRKTSEKCNTCLFHRFENGGWEVVEQVFLSDVSRVEKEVSILWVILVLQYTKSGRWMCKEVTENVDLRSWILQKQVTRGVSADLLAI